MLGMDRLRQMVEFELRTETVSFQVCRGPPPLLELSLSLSIYIYISPRREAGDV